MCRIGIRALDILNNLPPVRRKLIHRELISFASQLMPDHVFFAHHSQASEMMTSFREEEWESAGNIVLELGNCPPENKKLRCWLRPRAGEPLSQASLSRVAHSLQPGRERITDWLSQVAPGFGPITTDPAIRVNPHNSNLDPRQAYSPFFKPKTCSSVIESAQSALQQDMIPEIQNPRPATSNQHDWGYDDFLPDWGQGVGAQFQYPLFHQERQYQQPQQGQLAQTNEPSQPRQ